MSTDSTNRPSKMPPQSPKAALVTPRSGSPRCAVSREQLEEARSESRKRSFALVRCGRVPPHSCGKLGGGRCGTNSAKDSEAAVEKKPQTGTQAMLLVPTRGLPRLRKDVIGLHKSSSGGNSAAEVRIRLHRRNSVSHNSASQ